ncbi:hypothetical protein HHJ61_01080 [Avibacterium paragallinarum]|nr:hypothetical protein EIA51_08960 [Avibacterium paragallinarum]QIR13018.1 hypothetical protein HBL79_07960 [Avibacterium paragallinarum]QJE10894.1 hypothetical protein HHJ62_01080 [Avibacterium paragallinarum]QJE13087.1 hypothetical protein HHJ61_01080 [Avibacterium paragallinarum]QJE15288.1 hypothetical protein HHJ60_01085 [Avibacterium paragallinarum]
MGGNIFFNRDKKLPISEGRVWREADLGINNQAGREQYIAKEQTKPTEEQDTQNCNKKPPHF